MAVLTLQVLVLVLGRFEVSGVSCGVRKVRLEVCGVGCITSYYGYCVPCVTSMFLFRSQGDAVAGR